MNLSSKLAALHVTLQDLAFSVANETKSTAGDKYETARAMLQIEQDQVRHQIQDLNSQMTVLHSINPTQSSKQIVLGSLVETQDSYYYLSTGLGRISVEGKTVFALSMQSPLGASLKSLVKGNQIEMNGKKISIVDVW